MLPGIAVRKHPAKGMRTADRSRTFNIPGLPIPSR
jgi:hypothetical protein